MPDSNAAAVPASTPAGRVADPLMNTETLFKAVQQFGLPLVMLCVILWWAKNDIVKPLLDAHFEVIGQIVEGQNDHTERLDSIGDKLDELIRVSK